MRHAAARVEVENAAKPTLPLDRDHHLTKPVKVDRIVVIILVAKLAHEGAQLAFGGLFAQVLKYVKQLLCVHAS